jgi:uncharacterized protein YcfJ
MPFDREAIKPRRADLAASCVGIPINRAIGAGDGRRSHWWPDGGRPDGAIRRAIFAGYVQECIADSFGLVAVLLIMSPAADLDLRALEGGGGLGHAGLCLSLAGIEARVGRTPWNVIVADVERAHGLALDFASFPLIPGCRVIRRLAPGEDLGPLDCIPPERCTVPSTWHVAETIREDTGVVACGLTIARGLQTPPSNDDGLGIVTGILSGAATGAFAGYQFGSIAGPYGAFAGAFIGAVVGAFAGGATANKGQDPEIVRDRSQGRMREARNIYDQITAAISRAGDLEQALRTPIHQFPAQPQPFSPEWEFIRPGVRRPARPPWWPGPGSGENGSGTGGSGQGPASGEPGGPSDGGF